MNLKTSLSGWIAAVGNVFRRPKADVSKAVQQPHSDTVAVDVPTPAPLIVEPGKTERVLAILKALETKQVDLGVVAEGVIKRLRVIGGSQAESLLESLLINAIAMPFGFRLEATRTLGD